MHIFWFTFTVVLFIPFFPLFFGTVLYGNACKTLTVFPLIQILFSPAAGIIKKIPQEVHFNLLSQRH